MAETKKKPHAHISVKSTKATNTANALPLTASSVGPAAALFVVSASPCEKPPLSPEDDDEDDEPLEPLELVLPSVRRPPALEPGTVCTLSVAIATVLVLLPEAEAVCVAVVEALELEEEEASGSKLWFSPVA